MLIISVVHLFVTLTLRVSERASICSSREENQSASDFAIFGVFYPLFEELFILLFYVNMLLAAT